MGEVTGSFWRDRPTLITGATGLLGSWMVHDLLQNGADIVCLVRDWVPRSELILSSAIDSVRVVRGDVRDQDLLERVMGEYEIEVVFHLAAQTTVGVSNRNPVSTLDTNIRGTWTVLEASRRTPTVRAIALASSDKAYGDHGHEPYTESMELKAIHPYDASKASADLLAASYHHTFGVPVAITRCGNFFGGGDLNWNRLVPGTIRSALRGEQPVIRSDGSMVRDYFYVEDAAFAYRTLAEQLVDRPELAGEAFNFSNEEPQPALEFAQRILDRMGSDLSMIVQNQATNEIPYQTLNSSRARKELGWKPVFSIDEALDRTIAWYRNLLDQ